MRNVQIPISTIAVLMTVLCVKLHTVLGEMYLYTFAFSLFEPLIAIRGPLIIFFDIPSHV